MFRGVSTNVDVKAATKPFPLKRTLQVAEQLPCSTRLYSRSTPQPYNLSLPPRSYHNMICQSIWHKFIAANALPVVHLWSFWRYPSFMNTSKYHKQCVGSSTPVYAMSCPLCVPISSIWILAVTLVSVLDFFGK